MAVGAQAFEIEIDIVACKTFGRGECGHVERNIDDAPATAALEVGMRRAAAKIVARHFGRYINIVHQPFFHKHPQSVENRGSRQRGVAFDERCIDFVGRGVMMATGKILEHSKPLQRWPDTNLVHKVL